MTDGEIVDTISQAHELAVRALNGKTNVNSPLFAAAFIFALLKLDKPAERS